MALPARLAALKPESALQRPARLPPHPIEPWLARYGLRAATVRAYRRVAHAIDDSGMLPEAWLEANVGEHTPRRTIGVYRAATVLITCWRRAGGEDTRDPNTVPLPTAAEVAAASLALAVKTRIGRAGHDRTAPSAEQYARYEALLDSAGLHAPFRAILALLPLTGLRISEACSLRHDGVRQRGTRWYLHVAGKGGVERDVPLSPAAVRLLDAYVRANDPDEPHLFWNPFALGPVRRRAVQPPQVRRALRLAIEGSDASTTGELDNVVPHSMRHLYATMATKLGTDIRTVQLLLGHRRLATTERYLHPSMDMLEAGSDAAAEGLVRLLGSKSG